jgi:6-phosphofructokinase 1
MHKVAVLSSGGDASGMNAAIRAVVRTALYMRMRVYGVRRGFAGLIEDDMVEMNAGSVADIIQRGGTILQTSRSELFKTDEGRQKASQNLLNRGIETWWSLAGKAV